MCQKWMAKESKYPYLAHSLGIKRRRKIFLLTMTHLVFCSGFPGTCLKYLVPQKQEKKSKYIRKSQSRGLLSHLWHSLAQVFLPKFTAMAFPVEGFRMIIPSRMPWEGNGFSAYVQVILTFLTLSDNWLTARVLNKFNMPLERLWSVFSTDFLQFQLLPGIFKYCLSQTEIEQDFLSEKLLQSLSYFYPCLTWKSFERSIQLKREADIKVCANFPNAKLQLLSCLTATYEESGYTDNLGIEIPIFNTAAFEENFRNYRIRKMSWYGGPVCLWVHLCP